MRNKVTTMFALVTALLISSTPTAMPAEESSTPMCDLAAVVAGRVAELGETGRSTWVIAPDPDGKLWAWVDGATVTITPGVPCGMARDVVNHEWMHLLQGRQHSRGAAAYGNHNTFEMVADCGSKLLGSSYAPYETVIHPCTPAEYESAMWLLRKQGMAVALKP